MKKFIFLLSLLLVVVLVGAKVPSREEILKEMAIPSTDTVRGQKDGTGYATTKEQMDEIFKLSSEPPSPNIFGEEVVSRAFCVIVPHDDYLYAGRVYRELIPLIKAKVVFLIGPLHRWRDFEIKDKIVLENYKSWRTPTGEVKISKYRDLLLNGLSSSDFVLSNEAFDSEHSLEGPLYFLHYLNRDIQIVPILVTPMDFWRMIRLSEELVNVVGNFMAVEGINILEDVGIIISADAVHYGKDFNYTPYGDGGCEAYQKAVEEDINIVKNFISGSITERRVKAVFMKFQDLNAPEKANITWCGRFSIPFGMWFSYTLYRFLKKPWTKFDCLIGHPLCYSTSIGAPTLPSKTGLKTTSPSNLYHFVGYPGVYYTFGRKDFIFQNREVPPEWVQEKIGGGN